jgi:hypothetical protein
VVAEALSGAGRKPASKRTETRCALKAWVEVIPLRDEGQGDIGRGHERGSYLE